MTESPAVGVSPPYPVYDFTLSLEQPLVPMPHPFDDFDASMRLLPERGRQDHVDVRFAPARVKVDPFAGL